MAQLFGIAYLLLLVLALTTSNDFISRQAKKMDCFEPQGSPVRQMKPFRVCGEVHGMIESESATITYMPLPKFECSTNSCFEAGEFEVKFWIDWCHKTVPKQSLLMLRHIQDVDFYVDTSFDTFYIFYGCSLHYRTKFMMELEPICSNHCLPLMSYTWNRSDLPLFYATMENPARQPLGGKRVSIYRSTENREHRSFNSRPTSNHWITLLLLASFLAL